VTPGVLDSCTGCGLIVAQVWAAPLTAAMGKASIVTPLRQAAFLAQVGHESGGFLIVTENMNYSAEGLLATWPNHFDAASAEVYAHQPVKIANWAYANRMGNGNEDSGDGWMYRGHGPMQTTGRDDYAAASLWTGVDLLVSPEALMDPDKGSLAAAWEWDRSDCNVLADAGRFEEITQRINGGQIGAADRLERYTVACLALLNPVAMPPEIA